LDKLGTLPILTEPHGELAVILDLGGRLNKTDARVSHRYVMSVGQVAELVADIVVSAQVAGGLYATELGKAIAREQQRRGLTKQSTYSQDDEVSDRPGPGECDYCGGDHFNKDHDSA
jgi:hypothetical protein